MISIRPGATTDLGPCTALLNEIISVGGTTALTAPLSRAQLSDWIAAQDGRSSWHVAMDDSGMLLGFQWIGPWESLPPEACDIATFVRTDQSSLGIGSRLFDATRNAAIALGYDWINANIRADNEGGLAYYQSRGFRIWKRLEAVELADGSRVDKYLTRYDLKD